MKKSINFRAAVFVVLTSLLSGCFFPGDGWGHHGDRGHDHEHSDRDHRGDRGGDRGD